MRKLILLLALVPTWCFAIGEFVAATPIDNPNGSTCKVYVSEYRAGSDVMYLGSCGWYGLKGIGAYVQGWNHSNHVRIVRSVFNYGQPTTYSKVTYINKVNNTIKTYEEYGGKIENIKQYNLDDILADSLQAGLPVDHSIMAYIKFANYIDTME
jgi:hypothetical protein